VFGVKGASESTAACEQEMEKLVRPHDKYHIFGEYYVEKYWVSSTVKSQVFLFEKKINNPKSLKA
jgi:hypothetical protein